MIYLISNNEFVFKRHQAADRIFSPPRSQEEIENLEAYEAPSHHVLDDLPPDINDESENEDEAEEIFNEDDDGDIGDDGDVGDADEENVRGRTRGSMYQARSSFMTGKFIRLKPTPVPPLESELPCYCCLCHIEVSRDEAHNLTLEAEKKLFRNGLLGLIGDGLGVSFVRYGSLDLWQLLCNACGYINDENELEVDSEVFTVRFHNNHQNIEIESENIFDAFSVAPVLGLDVVRDIRSEFESLQRMAHIQQRYLRKDEEKRLFHFTADYQRYPKVLYFCILIAFYRAFTGLEKDEIISIYEDYVKPYERGVFRKFDGLEYLNALMVYLRTGNSVQIVCGMMYGMTDRNITVDSLSKNLRKMLFLLGRF